MHHRTHLDRRAHGAHRAPAALAALVVLVGSLTACGSGVGPERCVPEASSTAGAAELVGSYDGSLEAEGVRLTLAGTAGAGQGGTMTAENWPTGSFSRSASTASGPSSTTTSTPTSARTSDCGSGPRRTDPTELIPQN
ncbi:hypothetical protein [Streptomyces fradiae]|uniref:hypothetical protein n=1 Tax=Streptomyces fradiae TaxID=1906 RepID=UPI003511AAAA